MYMILSSSVVIIDWIDLFLPCNTIFVSEQLTPSLLLTLSDRQQSSPPFAHLLDISCFKQLAHAIGK